MQRNPIREHHNVPPRGLSYLFGQRSRAISRTFPTEGPGLCINFLRMGLCQLTSHQLTIDRFILQRNFFPREVKTSSFEAAPCGTGSKIGVRQ